MFAKQYPPASRFRQDVANEFRGLQTTHTALGSNQRFRVPEPYYYDEVHRLLLMEYCPSITLGTALFHRLRWSRFSSRSGTREIFHDSAQAGALLAEFQMVPVGVAQPSAEARDVLLCYRERFLRNVEACKAAGLPQVLLDRVREHVSQRLRMSEPLEIVVQHSDFGPWNILKAEPRFYLVDFHNFTLGLRAHDAAYFHVALDLWTRFRTVDGRTVRNAQDTFLASFQRARGGARDATRERLRDQANSLPLFRVLRIVHMTYFAHVVLSRRISPREVAYAPILRQRFFRQWFDREVSLGKEDLV